MLRACPTVLLLALLTKALTFELFVVLVNVPPVRELMM
jgi:hypothetical protein